MSITEEYETLLRSYREIAEANPEHFGREQDWERQDQAAANAIARRLVANANELALELVDYDRGFPISVDVRVEIQGSTKSGWGAVFRCPLPATKAPSSGRKEA